MARAVAGWITAALCLAVASGASRSVETPRVIVLITLDTLRADHVSFNGHVRTTTPYLDTLAEEGVVFTRAYAPSTWTPPSMASLFTGLYPTSHGIHYGQVVTTEEASAVLRQPKLPATLETLAEAMRTAGYTTIGVHSNLHLSRRLGFDQGFDYFAEPGVFPPAPEVNAAVRSQLEEIHGAAWRETWKSDKTFLWIHYFDPHDPYFARQPWFRRYAPDFAEDPTPYAAGLTLKAMHEQIPEFTPAITEGLRRLYDSEISFVDDRLRALGSELGLADPRVLTVVTSDHGEGLLDHGRVGHGNLPWEEEVRVPLLVRWPAGGLRAARLTTPVSLVDLFPTLIELVGSEPAKDLAGRSLEGLLRGSETLEARPIYFQVEPSNPPFLEPLPSSVALLDGDWKLIRERAPGAYSRLFHLPSDPGETRDRAAEERRRVEEMEATLRAGLAALPPPPEDLETVPLEDEELLEKLEALGYVGGG